MRKGGDAVELLVYVLAVLLVLLFFYHIWLQRQLRSINRQLAKRLNEKTRQPISLELINRELSQLVVHVNQSLKSEEQLRLDSIREEKRFKELIANLSHDLRTPLTAIKGYQQLLSRGELTAEQKDKLQVAQRHADELGSLIERFFEYSYVLSSDTEPVLTRVQLANLVMECLADTVAAFEDRDLTLRIKEAPQVYVAADQEMTMRIVHNLIRNCIAHAAGEVEVSVMAADQNNAVISFKNKVSSPDIDVQRLFDRFYTGDTARRKSTGLGLAIVKLLAEQMEGSASAALLEVDTLEIRVTLPLHKE